MRATIFVSTPFENGDAGTAPDSHCSLDVLDAAYHTAHSYPGGVPALAQRMKVNADTLMKKVSVNVESHHLTLKEAVSMQEVTGNVAVLQAMAHALGYVCVRSVQASTSDPMALNWQMVAAQADMQHAVADAFARGVTRNSLQRCDVLAAEATSAINNLLSALRASLPIPPGGVSR
ncbi:MAG: hypothetical protein K9K35_10520 [Rhodoferax sp.]|nr:hypothetical protein [Rhodoferax sp.]